MTKKSNGYNWKWSSKLCLIAFQFFRNSREKQMMIFVIFLALNKVMWMPNSLGLQTELDSLIFQKSHEKCELIKIVTLFPKTLEIHRKCLDLFACFFWEFRDLIKRQVNWVGSPAEPSRGEPSASYERVSTWKLNTFFWLGGGGWYGVSASTQHALAHS